MTTAVLIVLAVTTAVVFIAGPRVGPDEPRVAFSATVVTVYGIFSLIMGRRVKRRLDCSSESALAASYLRRFFLRLAFAESATWVAFVFAVFAGPPSVYFIGFARTMLALMLLAPSRRRLAADQRRLDEEGCKLSLVNVLATQPTRTRPVA